MNAPGATSTPLAWAAPRGLAGAFRDGVGWLGAKGRALATEPRYRRLRWILLVGLALRLFLAPLTSWGIDTPYFTLSAARMLQTGSPYGGYTFFNGPFGPVAELPGFAFATLFGSPSSWVQYAPALLPVAIHSQIVIPYLPTPGALLVLKLPMIAGDAVVAVLLYHAVRLHGGERMGTVAAAAWFLNPLVFWVSAVHGEVDTFAAMFVLAAILALERRLAFVAGVLLGLGTFAKVYPIVLVPLAVAFLACDAARGAGIRVRLLPVGKFLAGLAATVLPFLPLLAGLSVVLAHQAGNVNFGGFSLLIVFNPNITSIAGFWPPGTSAVVVAAFETTLLVGVVGGVAAIVYRFYRGPGTPVPEVPWLALLALAAVSGSLLAIVTTQAENIVAVLPLLLLATPWLGRSWSGLYWWLSLTAFGEYLALLTPLAFFYPLFALLGPGAVQWSNGIVLSYALDQTPVAAGVFWIVLGVLGGLALITVWAVSAARTWRLLTSRPADSGASERAPRAPPWQIPGRTSRSSAPATVAAVVVVALLTLEVGVTSVVAGSPRSVLQVSLLSVVSGFSNVVTTIRLTAGTIALAVHVGILPGTERFPGPIHVFADPAYPEPNGSFTTTEEVAERVALALSGSGDSVPIDTVNGGALPALLAAGPVGTLVVLGGLVPDTVLSNSSTALAAWVAGGGTLMWAGGPLGWSEGHPTLGGFVSDPLGWQGQLDLVHYPMSDVGSPGPLLSWNASPIAAAFGTTYNGTPAGADTSAVGGNGGVDLGLIGPSGAAGHPARSSLVYQPVGRGGVFFFGGSVWGSKQPPTDVPVANFALADDLALLLATGYVPTFGPSAYLNLHLTPRESVTLSLSVPSYAVTNGLVALVTTPTLPTFLSLWSTPLTSGPG